MLSTVLATKLGAAAAAGAVGLSGAAAVAYTGNLPSGLQDVAHRTIKAPPAHATGPDATDPAAYGLCQAFAKDKQSQDAKDQAKDETKGAASARPGGKPTDKPGKGPGRGNAKGTPGARGNGNGPTEGATGGPGKSKERSVAYRNLVRAAGGEDKVEAYCASVPRPSGEPEASDKPEKPEKAHPTTTPAHATGKPSSSGGDRSAAPTATASAEPTGEPTPSP